MARRRSCAVPAFLLLGLLVTLAAITSSQAQSTIPPATRIYRLERTTTYQHGCFAPCMCPVAESSSVRGVFRLTKSVSDPLFDHYSVGDVNWLVVVGTTKLRITGSGTYRIGGEFARQHQLALDLKVGDLPVEHYDSGLVAGGAGFPAIDIGISIHGRYCLDTAFDLRARPLMRLGIAAGSVSWDLLPEATGYDVVGGDIEALRQTAGDFRVATTACVANDQSGTSAPFGGAPPPGRAFWFLGRDIEAGSAGTYDSGDVGQVGSSDAGIISSPASCP